MLDEPLAHLDQINAKIIKDYLWRFIKSEKITTLFVTHNPLDALAYSSRLAIVNDGKITETGNPRKLYEQPNELYTAELLGTCFKINKNLIPEKHLRNKRGSYYLRPEMIHINDAGSLKTEVINCTYYGDRQLIQSKIQNTKIEFYADPNEKISKGDTLNITINFEYALFIQR